MAEPYKKAATHEDIQDMAAKVLVIQQELSGRAPSEYTVIESLLLLLACQNILIIKSLNQ